MTYLASATSLLKSQMDPSVSGYWKMTPLISLRVKSAFVTSPTSTVTPKGLALVWTQAMVWGWSLSDSRNLKHKNNFELSSWYKREAEREKKETYRYCRNKIVKQSSHHLVLLLMRKHIPKASAAAVPSSSREAFDTSRPAFNESQFYSIQ